MNKAQFTHAPPLHTNLLLAGLQLHLWWLLHPSAWRNFVRHCDATLPPTFALLQLHPAHLRHAELRRALLAGMLMPVVLWAVLCGGLALLGQLSAAAVLGASFGFGTLLVLCCVAGFASGVVGGGALVLAFTLLWRQPNFILLDVLLGPHLGIGWGLLGLLLLWVESNMTERQISLAAPRQLGGLFVGLIVGVLTITVVILSITSLFARGGTSNGQNQGVEFISLIPAAVLGLAAFIRTRQVTRAVLWSALYFFGAALAFGDVGREYSREPSSWQLLASTRVPLAGVFLIAYSLALAIVERVAGRWAGVVTGNVAALGLHYGLQRIFGYYAFEPNALIHLLGVVLGLTVRWWLPLLLLPFESALSTVLYQGDVQNAQTQRLHLQPIFWNELQRSSAGSSLPAHVLLMAQRAAPTVQAALNFVASTPQAALAQRIQIELDAQRMEACAHINDISNLTLVASSGAASDILGQFATIADDVRVALRQTSTYNCGLLLTAVQDQLSGFIGALNRRDDDYARRFRNPAQTWLGIVQSHQATLQAQAQQRGEIPSPYIVGTPLTRHQGIFVGRTDISARIEALLRNDDQPPLLLYGQRRMGKTSLLFNLRWLLPARILPLVVDLQGPVTLASDHAAFLYNLAKGMSSSAAKQSLELPPLSRASLVPDPFTAFDDWLDAVEQTLTQTGKTTVLLALDEFEALDEALARGQLDGPAIMGTLRHIIQYRPRFKLILAGSHSVEEFQRWASYLINAQTIHLSYLKESETLQLVEHPIKDFPLRYLGEASQRVLAITRGHPYLVQLLCSEIVAFKNEQDTDVRYTATLDDVEKAMLVTLERGQQFFTDIARNQLDDSACVVAHFVAIQGKNCAVERKAIEAKFGLAHSVSQAIAILLHREVLETRGTSFTFQVELVRQWFARVR
jgi:hypothetical protein